VVDNFGKSFQLVVVFAHEESVPELRMVLVLQKEKKLFLALVEHLQLTYPVNHQLLAGCQYDSVFLL
jgi:hypothetical protein